MAHFGTGRVLVVGGTGRLGGLLRRSWERSGQDGLLWQRRKETGAGPCFEPLSEPRAYAAAAAGAGVILNLAGRVGAEARDLADHAALALAALKAAKAAGVAHVFLASSAAVYGAAALAREDDPVAPVSDYGRAKVAMERAARDWAGTNPGGPGVTCLRIANVAGADQLLGAPRGAAPQSLHVFADGAGPRRSYIGPGALARILGRLMALGAAGTALPGVLNVALDGAVAMEALLEADGRTWSPCPAPEGILPLVQLEVSRLASLLGPLPPCDPAAIVADLRSIQAEAA